MKDDDTSGQGERSSMTEEQAFQDLIRRVRTGDKAAAAELVRDYEPAIRRVARIRLIDTRLQRYFDSLDIAQSVFASFFVRMALGQYDLDKPEQLLKLLATMSRKKLVDRIRKEEASCRDYRRLAAFGPTVGQALASDPTPSQEVAGQELLEEFRKRLSADERYLADQRSLGRDWAQIAADQGGSPEALRKQLARAIDRIASQLGLSGFAEE
jgi:RNA polymerase sigma factor (sigma-70 family)